MNQVVIAVLMTLVVSAILVGVALLCAWQIRRARDQAALVEKLVKACDQMIEGAEGLRTSAEQLASLPKLIDGHLKVATSFALEISKLRLSIQQFTALVTKPGMGQGRGLADVASEAGGSLKFEATRIAMEHPEWSWEEAMKQAYQDEEQRGNLPYTSTDGGI